MRRKTQKATNKIHKKNENKENVKTTNAVTFPTLSSCLSIEKLEEKPLGRFSNPRSSFYCRFNKILENLIKTREYDMNLAQSLKTKY